MAVEPHSDEILAAPPAVPSIVAGSLAELAARRTQLRDIATLADVVTRLLRDAAERLQEREDMPEAGAMTARRHVAAEATGLWRAAWSLCAVRLAGCAGMVPVLEAVDRAGSALAADTPASIPTLAVAATAMARIGAATRMQLALAEAALDRMSAQPGPLPGTDLGKEAARLRALQLRQALAGRTIGLDGLIPECLRDTAENEPAPAIAPLPALTPPQQPTLILWR